MKYVVICTMLFGVCIGISSCEYKEVSVYRESNTAVLEYDKAVESGNQELIDETAYKLYKTKIKKENFDSFMNSLDKK